jgi:hypothetical protein
LRRWPCHGGEQPIVVFDYQPGRGHQRPQAFLRDYRGLLMSGGYDAWRTPDDAVHLGCMARRLSHLYARPRYVDDGDGSTVFGVDRGRHWAT